MYITGPVEATRIWGDQVHITYVVVLVVKKRVERACVFQKYFSQPLPPALHYAYRYKTP